MNINRREFMASTAALLAATQTRAASDQKLTAAIIGHTGKGDYGHGLDTIFHGLPDVELAAIADPDDAGRAKAVKRCKPLRDYANWHDMLDKERPNLVSIAPRITGERLEMLTAALNAGAHVICEKPFVRTPADGDQVLDLARRKNLKITVMHQMRMAPSVVNLKKKIEQGALGELVQMNAWGKQDKRAGGEDLAVLGIHMFDLMRMFAGDPVWCSARVLENGQEATAADVKQASEDIGPVLGSDISAQFSFANEVFGTFTSRPSMRDYAGHWELELIGSKGAARIVADILPTVLLKRPGKWEESGRTDDWRPFDDDPSAQAPPAERTTMAADRRLAEDWLASIADNREPTCSGQNAAKAIEMEMAVWCAGLSGGRVRLPLKERGHALVFK